MTASGPERGAAAFERLCNRGLDLPDLRSAALHQMRSLLSVDAAFFATVDPVTLLFTSALAEEPLTAATSLFLDNEFGRDDVNKFAHLATSLDPVATLDRATRGERSQSARYREVMAPLGLGDELRLALLSGGQCWGVLCLHREDGPLGFDERDIRLLRRIAPHLAGGLRRSVARAAITPDEPTATGPGIIVLDADLSIVSINPQAERWLHDLADADWPAHLALPVPIHGAAVAARLSGNRPGADDIDADHTALVPPTTATLRRAEGGWLTVHASPLSGAGGQQVAVVLDAASPAQVSSVVLAAHGLTPAQMRVAALVLQGRSTRHIVAELHISAHTVQEHLHAVFDKFGIGSRRELVAALSGRPR